MRTTRHYPAQARSTPRLGIPRGVMTLILVATGTGCGPTEQGPVTGVVRDGVTGSPIAGVTVRAASGSPSETDSEGRFRIEVPVGSDRVIQASGAGRCSSEQRVAVRKSDTGEVIFNLFPRWAVEESHLQVGYGREVVVEARLRCDRETELRWRQLAGPPLGDRLHTEDHGHRLIVRTHTIEDLTPIDDRIGIVPISRRARGDYQLEVEGNFGGMVEKHQLRITAGATTAGVFQIPTGVDVYLTGGLGETHRWELTSTPNGSSATLSSDDGRITSLRADRFGQYLISHQPSGTQINIQAGPFESVPRDCGRSACHKPEDDGWANTVHANTFRRGLSGELGPGFTEGCWGCHATGVDPGVENGGLHQTAQRLGWHQPQASPAAWENAPRQIRRHGSVWCSACHGPGRILPPAFHWEYGAKYQSGVCAQCHDAVDDPDAPHTSPHVREWAMAKMATFVGRSAGQAPADDDPALERGCASCHGAQGFIAWLDRDEHIAPDRATVAAITCTTCHDPHDASRPRALRAHGEVASIGGRPAAGLGAGAICATCHRGGQLAAATLRTGDGAPHAPQADVLLGRGARGVRAEGGVHATLEQSCVACHMARDGDDRRLQEAGGHTFSARVLSGPAGANSQVPLFACIACHEDALDPRAIGGNRDRDGDGAEGTVVEELDRALAAARSRVEAQIRGANVRDACDSPRTAVDFVEYRAELVLIGAGNVMLGDCNRDGRLATDEQPVALQRLPAALRDSMWNLSLIEKDGSRGLHNPDFAFAVLRAVR